MNDKAAPAKAEGLALLKDHKNQWELLVVFDGLKDGDATRFSVKKPD